MKKVMLGIFAVLFLFSSALCSVSFCQEAVTAPAEEAVAPQEPAPIETYSAFGEVVSISSTSITITEYDYDTEEEKQGTYSIDANTVLENVESVQGIQQGTEVSIDYVVSEGNKKATNIYVYEG